MFEHQNLNIRKMILRLETEFLRSDLIGCLGN